MIVVELLILYTDSVTADQVELPVELLRLEKTLCDKPQVHNRQKIMQQTAKVAETIDRYVEGYSMLLSDLLIFAMFHYALVSINGKCLNKSLNLSL